MVSSICDDRGYAIAPDFLGKTGLFLHLLINELSIYLQLVRCETCD